MDGMHRILIAGKNGSLSRTAAQDTAAGSNQPPDEGMEFYMAYLYSRQAGEEFLKAHMLHRRDRIAADFHHVNAMEQMDKLAETLGLEIVARKNVVT